MIPLSELLAGRDRWDGAACLGDWATFDPRHDRENETDYLDRVRRAQTVCARCPIFDDCRGYASGARPRDRAGVWAGQPYDSSGRPVRIPSKEPK